MKSLRLSTLCIAMCCGLAACADEPKRTDWKFGESVPSTMKSQVLNPSAGGDKPVEGMDGESAMQAAKRHEKMGGGDQKPDGVLEQMLGQMNGQGSGQKGK